MKKELIALSLIAGSGLFAGGDCAPQANESGYCNTCCSYPCCCEPCCVPQPKKCIDCECYVPPFYDLQCDWGVALDVEFLYWYARETNLNYAVKAQMKALSDIPDDLRIAIGAPSAEYLGTSWDPGVRVGLGLNMDCDGWDTYLSWTYMKNTKKSSTSVPRATGMMVPGNNCLFNPWMNQSFAYPINTLESVSAKWSFRFNQIDLEIGRKSWISRCFALRPYAGLRGAWWNTKFSTLSSEFEPETDFSPERQKTFDDTFKNCTWGVGLVAGIQPAWYFCSNFALFSNLSAALVWGDLESKKREAYTAFDEEGTQTIDYEDFASSHSYQMTPILDLALGLRWEESWCYDRYRTALDLGWEHHILFDQNHRLQSENGEGMESIFFWYTGTQMVSNNIGLGGFVLRARFDF